MSFAFFVERYHDETRYVFAENGYWWIGEDETRLFRQDGTLVADFRCIDTPLRDVWNTAEEDRLTQIGMDEVRRMLDEGDWS